MRYIYITTNLINGKKYIGQRNSPKNIKPENDSYLGTGSLILKAIKKYGKNNFKKEIVCICHSHKQADKIEIKLIKKYNAVDSEDYYNIDSGGQFYRSEKHKETTSKSMSYWYNNDKNYTNSQLKKFRKKYKETGRFPKWLTIAERDLYKLRNKLRQENKQYNKNEAKKVVKLVNDVIRKKNKRSKKQLIKDLKKAAKQSWEGQSRNTKIKSLKQAWIKRKAKGVDDDGYLFKVEHRRKYSLKKLEKSNNYFGIWLIENGFNNISFVNKKITKLINTPYKSDKNFHIQLDKVIDLIYKQNIIDKIDKYKIILLINKSRKLKGNRLIEV